MLRGFEVDRAFHGSRLPAASGPGNSDINPERKHLRYEETRVVIHRQDYGHAAPAKAMAKPISLILRWLASFRCI